MLDLEGGFDNVWMKKFEGSARTGARKEEREGVEVECDPTGRLIPEMHQMLEDSVARWARRQHEPLWLASRRQKARDPLERYQSIAATSATGAGCGSPGSKAVQPRACWCSSVPKPTTSGRP